MLPFHLEQTGNNNLGVQGFFAWHLGKYVGKIEFAAFRDEHLPKTVFYVQLGEQKWC